jgi:bifunctional non-homologous end joining protein LigD
MPCDLQLRRRGVPERDRLGAVPATLDRRTSMPLERYRRKRDFRMTPEPKGGRVGKAPRPRKPVFVVQKHFATRPHYDFRLEHDGVLLSWAVPKGPSLDPNDKRLAMHVEDHPLEYGDFEGVIPPKQYGAGTVMVWDRGTWAPKGDPRESYAKGRLKFELQGEKLKGGWNLVRTKSARYGSSGDPWLLFKEADEFARLGPQAAIVDDRPDSVATGRSIDEIAAAADRVWQSNKSAAANVKAGAVRRKPRLAGLAKVEGARKAPLPDALEPQLATAAKVPPSGPSWVHEVKHDGYRMLCRIDNGEARMISRSAKDWTADFPAVVRALARLPVRSAWIDGEVVALDARGRSSFQRLQNALDGGMHDLTFLAFDLLYLDGYDLREVALGERKRLLEKLLSGGYAGVKYSGHFAVPGADFLESVRALGLEGVVSKRVDLPYRPGRGPAWQKAKCLRRQEMVIGGFTDPEGSRQGFGALLLGVHEPDGRLRYSGKVGTGFDDATLAKLRRRLDALVRKEPAFHNPPRGADARRAHWVEPALVAEVEFSEWTDDGTLRHPSFVGLRADKPATQVVREDEPAPAAAAAPAAGPTAASSRSTARAAKDSDANAVAGVALTHPDKLLYPDAGLTKRDLARYYATVAERMLPHVGHRPLTLLRCPDGWKKACFYQKNADASVSDAISRVRIDDGDGGESLYMMAESRTALVALLQLGVLEIHPWGSRAGRLGHPDRLIFDLDPDDDTAWDDLRDAAHLVRTLLDNIGLPAFLKTTGGKGLHVVTPIEPTVRWEDAKAFTKAVAELLERTFPDRFTSKLLKVSRRGKIFIDYLRNAEGATAIGAYSTRARANAPVSTPLAWDELERDVRFDHFNVRNVPQRLAEAKRDPWRDLDAQARRLTAAIMARVGFKGTD